MNGHKPYVLIIMFYKMAHGLVYAVEIVDYNIAGGQSGEVPIKKYHGQIIIYQTLYLLLQTGWRYNNITIYLRVAKSAQDILCNTRFVFGAGIKDLIIEFVSLFLHIARNGRKKGIGNAF